VEAIPVDEAVRAIMDGIATGALSIYVPEYFAEFASGKAQDVDGFLAGAAEFVRAQAQQAADR
jgi:hypothetical protein